MKNKKYRISEGLENILYPDPIIYGGKEHKTELSIISELQHKNMDEIYLTKYGKMLKEHLQDNKPEMYKELLENGTLDEYCQEKDEKTIELINSLMDQGMNSTEAQEVAISQLLEMPPPNIDDDDDEPSLIDENGYLIIPNWMFNEEVALGIIIDNIIADGDGKEDWERRVELHNEILRIYGS